MVPVPLPQRGRLPSKKRPNRRAVSAIKPSLPKSQKVELGSPDHKTCDAGTSIAKTCEIGSSAVEERRPGVLGRVAVILLYVVLTAVTSGIGNTL